MTKRRPLANADQSWDAHWRRDAQTELSSSSVPQLMDSIKFRYLESFLPSDGVLIEFGCGSARLSRFVAGRGLRAIAVDRSPQALLVAKEGVRQTDLGVRIDLVRCDAAAACFGSEVADVVASTGLLEHFQKPWPIVHEMVRVLKRGGLFYSDIVPAKFSLYRCLDWLRFRQAVIFERRLSRSEIEELLSSNGLSEVEVFGAGVFPPRLPLLERSALVRKSLVATIEATLPLWQALDRTWLANVLGFYFFAVGRKAL